jgi:hypothetical protein
MANGAGQAETKVCPFCKSDIPKDASACRHCGKDVSTAAVVGKGLTALGCMIMLLAPLAVILFLVIAGSC